jgi:hypothetical protein
MVRGEPMRSTSARDAASDLTPTSTVAEALRHLDLCRREAAVVMEGATPVGVVTRARLERLQRAHPQASAQLRDVMDLECVSINPAAGELETLRAYSAGAWDSLRRRRPCAKVTLARRAASLGGPA